MANGLYSVDVSVPAPVVPPAQFAEGEVLLFSVRREDLRPRTPPEGPDAADFAARWWPGEDFDAE